MLQLAVFAIVVLVAIAVVFYGGIGFLTYTLYGAKFGVTPKAAPYNQMPPIGSGWSFVYSNGVSGDASSFTFPKTDGVHYIVTKAVGIAMGKTITMRFNIGGVGELKVADPSDIQPATVRLFIWGQGVNDRWWIRAATNLADGDQTVSAVIDPGFWGGVGGIPPVVQASFESVVANPHAMGFTLGGQYFAGHGVFCPEGTKTFKLLEYSIA